MEHIAQGERIRALREGRHLSQPQVLRGLEEQEGAPVISLRGYQLWEGSKPKKPKGIKWENAVALGKFFGVDPEVLVSREAGPTPDLIAQMNGTDDDRLARMEALLRDNREVLGQIRDALVALAQLAPAQEEADRHAEEVASEGSSQSRAKPANGQASGEASG